MNVMITSVGRRAYMVQYFRKALDGNGKVHVCNSDDRTVAFHYADEAVISPLIYDENYIPFLVDYCQKNRIDILLSLFDMDLLMLARHKAEFEAVGTRVIVSDSAFIEKCNDKWKTCLFLKENGFRAPKTFLSLEETLSALENGEIRYPVVVKPRFGCGSIAVSIAEDEEALRYYARHNAHEVEESYLKYESKVTEEKLVYQEFLHGQEYGADVINDLNGQYRTNILRKKIAMRAGETDIAAIVEDARIQKELERLGRLTGHVANMDCDIFLADGEMYILEMNARFGGGYPFSHMAGCDLPRAIVEWSKGGSAPDEMLKARTGQIGYKELVIHNFG